jgi:hypothetical protein
MNLSLSTILPMAMGFLGNCVSFVSSKPMTDEWIEKTRDAQNDSSGSFYPMALGATFTASLSLLFSGSSFLVFIGIYFKYKNHVAEKQASRHQSARDNFNVGLTFLSDSIFNKTLDIKNIIEKLYESLNTTMQAIGELKQSFEYLKLDYSNFKREIDDRLSDSERNIISIISNHEHRMLNLFSITAMDHLSPIDNLNAIYETPNKIPKCVMGNSFLFCDKKNDHEKISNSNVINL